MKKLSLLLFLFVLFGCKDKNTLVCEEFVSKQTYLYEDVCKCFIQNAKENGVENFEDIITFMRKNDNKTLVLKSILADEVVGQKTKKILKTMSDIDAFCDFVPDKKMEKTMYLIDNNGEFVSKLDGYNITLSKDFIESNDIEILENNVYQGDSLVGLLNFINSRIKNVNIKQVFSQVDSNTIEVLKNFDKKVAQILLSYYDNDFAMMYFYFLNVKKYSPQEAIDQAYAQAWSALIWKINNVGLLDKYMDSHISFYKKNKDKAVFVSKNRKKFIDSIKRLNEKDI